MSIYETGAKYSAAGIVLADDATADAVPPLPPPHRSNVGRELLFSREQFQATGSRGSALVALWQRMHPKLLSMGAFE